jgi:YD repeat-containing protein
MRERRISIIESFHWGRGMGISLPDGRMIQLFQNVRYHYDERGVLRSHRWNDGSIEHFGQQMRLTGFCKIIDNGEHISIRCFLESGGSGISYFRQNKPL